MLNKMLKIRKELWVMILQFIVFLGSPMIAKLSGEVYGLLMVLLIIYPVSVLALSIAISWMESKLKYLYPLYVAIIFLPIAYIFLNNSAYVYSLVFAGISAFGIMIGVISNYISKLFTKDKKEEIK